ncbi:MAG: hypothetical protein QNK03_17795 [Myxococcota bacterium]|nr:hypothetical protein [Myxococcota bacterium]
MSPHQVGQLVGACAVALALAAPALAQNQPWFSGVGDLAGGAVDSFANAVSADGSVVVGGSEGASGPEAFRWTAGGGIVGLGDLPGGVFHSVASGVSADGSVIAGTGVDSSDDSRAFRWTQGAGLVALGQFFCSLCPPFAFGEGVSGDGLVVVGAGTGKPVFGDITVEAARWTGGGTSIDGIGHLSGPEEASGAAGASHDGAVIVGDSDSSGGIQGFYWDGSMHGLGGWPGAQLSSSAAAISADASTIVGFANTSPSGTNEKQAVRWTGAGYASVSLLGSLPGSSFPGSKGCAVSGDGGVIVGTANDENDEDAAFLWDAIHGMRKLQTVLEQDYGLDLTGWTLGEASGVSDVNGAGEFTVVGHGTNPSGDPEGWVAFLSPTACNDGVDNDGDGLVDFPADPECTRRADRSETESCADGLDNDGDGQTDFPADAGCSAADDQTERHDCADAFDNDGDGHTDFPADPGCRNAAGEIEDPACDDGLDNDSDLDTDYPADAGCVAADDRSETADCSDGLDNDGDGHTDFPADPDCTLASDPAEDPQCDDRIDNDVDGRIDFPDEVPECVSAADPIEAPQCDDGVDNDGDGATDWPADPECESASFPSESVESLALGDLLVVDREVGHLFRVDPATGAQTLLAAGGLLGAPQGVAVRATGEVVVADPGGLVHVVPDVGTQRRLSGPLEAFESVQVVFDANGDAVALVSSGLDTIGWVEAGQGARAPLLALPFGVTLLFYQGDSLAREASGDLLVSGFGALGDGVFRVAPDASSVTGVTPGFATDIWRDLAVEGSGAIVAVGADFVDGEGVYRIDPTSGTVSLLSNDPAWSTPVAIAVGASGDLFVGDAGSCDASGCSGGSLVRVDPASGARLDVWSGGSITGRMDLARVSALPACADGADNDADLDTDFPADAGCALPWDASELPACADGVDNDGDGLVDWGADPGCRDADSNLEDPACDDGLDNDSDGQIDTADPHCPNAFRNKETPKSGCGLGAELLLVLPLLRLAGQPNGSKRSRSPAQAKPPQAA